jgi:Domain of unknown function (DUF1772)
MDLDDASALAQWGPSYDRAFNYQGGLAVVAAGAGFMQAWVSGDWRWAVGGALMLANWPYTLIVILPLNHQLKAIRSDAAGPISRAMLGRWNRLHAARTGLSAIATLIYLWSAAQP